MADEINLDAGDDAEDVIAGKKNQQQRNEQRANPRQSQSNYFGGNDGTHEWVVAQIIDHAQQLRELTTKLDDLPNKVRELTIKVDKQEDRDARQNERNDKQDARIQRLEDLEVVVRKEEVVIRPVTPPDSPNISTRKLTILLIIVATLILFAVVFLIALQVVPHG